MGKPLEESDMPPLTRDSHKELRALENLFYEDLGSCTFRDELLDAPKAFEYTRTYALEFYDHYYNFYSQYPDYREHWKPASAAFALQRVVHGINSRTCISRYFKEDQKRVTRITRTISDHAKNMENPSKVLSSLTGKQISNYQLAGIDLTSPSPLLKKAFDEAKTVRPSVFTPVQANSRNRISRSVHSEKAARRMEVYLQEKGLTQTKFCEDIDTDAKTLYSFRRTGNVGKSVAKRIADAMGVTFEEFIS
jgi:hypothetical protein